MQSTTNNSNEQIQIPCHVTRKAAIDVSEHRANVPTKLAVAVAVAVAVDGWMDCHAAAATAMLMTTTCVYVCVFVYNMCCAARTTHEAHVP